MVAAPRQESVPLSSLVSLEGEVAVVTGAGRGIGRAIARRLAEAGADLALADLDRTAVEDLASELARFDARTMPIDLDVRNSSQVAALATETAAAFGKLTTWVNAAGIFPMTPLWETDDETWSETVDVNLRGTFVGCREAARQMRETGGGAIVNIASTAALGGGPEGHAAYTASKAGVIGLTRNLAKSLGPHGIRVFAIAPGHIQTEGINQVRDNWAAAGHVVDEAAMTANLPLGRVGYPDDVALVAYFCACRLATYTTGQTFVVDGGGAKL